MRTCTAFLLVASCLAAGCAQSPGHLIRVAPPIKVLEAERLRDGGSLRLAFSDESKRTFTALMDYRAGGTREGLIRWVPPDYNATTLMPRGGELEDDLTDVLEDWLEANVTPEVRASFATVGADGPPADPPQVRQAWIIHEMVRIIRGRAGYRPEASLW